MKKTLILILFALLSTASVSAEDEIPTIEEIVVTATRIEEPKEDVSASTQIITQDDIKNSTAKDAGDLITEGRNQER